MDKSESGSKISEKKDLSIRKETSVSGNHRPVIEVVIPEIQSNGDSKIIHLNVKYMGRAGKFYIWPENILGRQSI